MGQREVKDAASEARRSQLRRRLFGLAAVLLVAAGVLGGFAASGRHPPTSNASPRPVTVPLAFSVTRISLRGTGPYFMPGYFGRVSGKELWAANGVDFYVSRNGATFTVTEIPGLSGDLASTLLAVSPAGTNTYAIAMTASRSFGTCGHFEVPSPSAPAYMTSAVAVTADNGRSWTRAVLPKCGVVTSLSLADAEDGFALTFPGGAPSATPTLLDATTDGGRSWHVVGAAPQALEITFASATLGFGIGDGARLGGDLERTTDGGHSWERVALPVPRAYRGEDLGVDTPTFFNADDGVVDLIPETSGNTRFDHVLVDVTHDGGSSWTTAVSPAERDLAGYGSPQSFRPGQPQLVPFSAVSMRTWVFLLGPELYETVDGGASWTEVTPDPQWPAGLVTRVSFATASLGWAFAGRQSWNEQLFVTISAGRTWRAVSNLAP
jgi:photosystem II stability/assembly factor-like uncharacterized protein